MKTKFIVLALVVAAVAGLGASTASNARSHPVGPPDTRVTDWDAVGTQAFTAAALSPAEGHVIFAYVAIAVYDSVMAVKGGYEPFVVDVEAPAGTSAEAAVTAAAHSVFVHYLRLRRSRSSILRTRRRWQRSRTGRRRRTASLSATASPLSSSPCAQATASGLR